MFGKIFRGNCRGFRGVLSQYIDGRVTPSEKQALESHLASCERCRQELESLRATVGLLHRVPMEAVPRSFTVMEAMPARPVAAPRALVPLRWATVCAVVVLAFVFAGDLMHVYPEKKSPASETKIVASSQTPGSQENGLVTVAPNSTKLGAPQGVGDSGLTVTPTPNVPEGQAQVTPQPTSSFGVSPVSPAVPTPAAGDLAGNTAGNNTAIIEEAASGYSWPVHQMEFALLGVAVVMLAATITVWRRSERSSVKVRKDE